VCVTKHIRI